VYLRSLGLEQFRCHERADIELGPGLNVFVGPNASGKTSVLEAVHLLAVTKSHRTTADRELIRWDQPWARVTGQFRGTDGRDVQLRVTVARKANGGSGDKTPRKTMEVNQVPRRRLSETIGQAAVVLFGPDDLALIKGPPSIRRHFLNAGIAQVRPAYLADLLRYRQALRQRNEHLRLVRRENGDRSLLSAWDVPLAESGARLATARAEFCAALATEVQRIHFELSGRTERLQVSYRSDLGEAFDVETRRALLRDLLGRNVDRDLALGRTLSGPHRDELVVELEGRTLRDFGSQGQQRTAALSLTLAQAQAMQQWGHEAPIVLLDDCLSELDETRARRVLQLTESVEQVIVTTASWDRMLQELAGSARVWDVSPEGIRERVSDAGSA
jgi:DNA replication and repair protein RecF